MATVAPPPILTAADMLCRLGDIPLARIRMVPPPGTATEEDVVRACETGTPCELIDGILVEKAMGYFESIVEQELSYYLRRYLGKNDLSFLLGPAAPQRPADHVRIPDLGFFLWSRFPRRKLPRGGVLGMAPDLAIEVLSPGNTDEEMERKRAEYFSGGTRLVWIIDPETRTAEVYTSLKRRKQLTARDAFTGGKLLPGFRLRLAKLFERVRTE